MRRVTQVSTGFVVAIVAAGVFIALWQFAPALAGAQSGVSSAATAAAPGVGDQSTVTAVPGAATYAYQPGAPAISPIPGLANAPTFTSAAVKQYYATHSPLYQSYGAPPATVGGVQFISAKDAGAQVGHQIDRADDALVCLVTLHGQFEAAGPPGLPVAIGSTEYAIFDATTGNLIGDVLEIDKRITQP